MPPSCATPLSKLTRVRSDGFSKTSPTTRPRQTVRRDAPRVRRLQARRLREQVRQLVGGQVDQVEKVLHVRLRRSRNVERRNVVNSRRWLRVRDVATRRIGTRP